MIKKISIMALLSISCFAKPLWFTNEQDAGKYAYEHKIPIVIVEYSNHCEWCKKTLNSFKDGKLSKVLNSGKIVFLGIQNNDPRVEKYKLDTDKLPSFFFSDPNGKQLGNSINGYLAPSELDQTLKKFYIWYEKNYVPVFYKK